jgi:hypothetical protein
MQRKPLSDHCEDDVASPQESRGRPPHLNEQVAGRRSGGARNVFMGDEGSDWGRTCSSEMTAR